MVDQSILQQLYEAYSQSRTIVTDSRKISKGCLFFAFEGAVFDGNSFAAEALQQGAALSIISKSQYATDKRCIVVDDVLETLQALARMHRQRLTIPIVAITGTNGKTTTKELVHAVLSRKYKVSATVGNHNNHLGVPLTILSIPHDATIAIVEMGANHPGEIDTLCSIAQPTHGVITNVGCAHLEGFGSFEGVVQTKTELYRYLASKHGTIFVNTANQRLLNEATKLATIPENPTLIPAYLPGTPSVSTSNIAQCPLSIVTYGKEAYSETLDNRIENNEVSEIRGSYIGDTPYMMFYFEVGDNVYTVQSNLLGSYNFHNAMTAVAIGLYFGVEPFDIKLAIEEYEPSNNRSQYKQTLHNRLYLDCYNANPSSMAAAIDAFREMGGSNKMAIIGGMKELGSASEKEHRVLVERLAECQLDKVILVGNEFNGIVLPDNFTLMSDVAAVKKHLESHPISDRTILVKGSNSNRLWTLEENL